MINENTLSKFDQSKLDSMLTKAVKHGLFKAMEAIQRENLFRSMLAEIEF